MFNGFELRMVGAVTSGEETLLDKVSNKALPEGFFGIIDVDLSVPLLSIDPPLGAGGKDSDLCSVLCPCVSRTK